MAPQTEAAMLRPDEEPSDAFDRIRAYLILLAVLALLGVLLFHNDRPHGDERSQPPRASGANGALTEPMPSASAPHRGAASR